LFLGFSKSLAKEVARKNIRVNVIVPGFIETDMTSGNEDTVIMMIINMNTKYHVLRITPNTSDISMLSTGSSPYLIGDSGFLAKSGIEPIKIWIRVILHCVSKDY